MNSLSRSCVAIGTVAAAACSVDTTASDTEMLPASQGVVVGQVEDTAGRGIPNAVVCAATAFSVFGTPTLVTRQTSTNATGAYIVPINLTYEVDARAGLTVAATPSAASGLEPAYTSGATVLITGTPPPTETTRVNVVVRQGPSYQGVFCTFGP